MSQTKPISLYSKFSIVLGGLGLIGKAVVKELLRSDAKVLILDIDKKVFDDFSLELGKEGLKCEFEYFNAAALNKSEIIIEKILNDNQDKVKDYKEGKTKLLRFFVGQAMKESKGKANPKKLNQILILYIIHIYDTTRPRMSSYGGWWLKIKL